MCQSRPACGCSACDPSTPPPGPFRDELLAQSAAGTVADRGARTGPLDRPSDRDRDRAAVERRLPAGAGRKRARPRHRRPARLLPVRWPTQPVVALRADPGAARLGRTRAVPRAAGEAVVGDPAAVRVAAGPQPGARAGTALAGAAGRQRAVRVRHRHSQHPVLVRVPLLLHPCALLRRVGVHRGVSGPRDAQVRNDAPVAEDARGSARGGPRTGTWVRSPVSAPPRSRRRPPRPRRCRAARCWERLGRGRPCCCCKAPASPSADRSARSRSCCPAGAFAPGPLGFPVNKTATAAGISAQSVGASWRLHLAGERSVSLSREQLLALPQHTYDLPIACVEGWSTTQRWSGVRLRDLAVAVRRAGAGHGHHHVARTRPLRPRDTRSRAGGRRALAAGAARQRRRPLARSRLPRARDQPGSAGRSLHEMGVAHDLRPGGANDPAARFRALYGAGPLHLLALLASFAIAGGRGGRLVPATPRRRGPCWSGSLRRSWSTTSSCCRCTRCLTGSRSDDGGSDVTAPRKRRRPGLVNPTPYLRIPAILSGLLLAVFFPVILGLGAQTELSASGIAETRVSGALAARDRRDVRAVGGRVCRRRGAHQGARESRRLRCRSGPRCRPEGARRSESGGARGCGQRGGGGGAAAAEEGVPAAADEAIQVTAEEAVPAAPDQAVQAAADQAASAAADEAAPDPDRTEPSDIAIPPPPRASE